MTDDLRDTTPEVDDSVTEASGDEAVADSPVRKKRRRRRLSRTLRGVILAVLAVLVLASGSVATWLYFKQYWPDQQTDAKVSAAVVSAASEGTVALLSYSADTLEQDFANARSHLSGDFKSYYDDFTAQMVGPTAKEKSLKTTAHVTAVAVSELHPDSAVVLVFVDQSTIVKDNPQPSLAFSSVLLKMTRVDGKWLINKFSPV